MADDRNKSFTSEKLNWLDCVMNDRDLKPAAFKIAYCIMQHVNAETLVAWLSDETIVDITGISRAQVQRHRESLKEAGWLTWKRTHEANHYTPLFDRVKAGLDDILAKRAKRKELRKTRRCGVGGALDASPVRQPDVSPVRQADASPVRHIHLQPNTYDSTPSISNNPERSASGSPDDLSMIGNPYRQTTTEAHRVLAKLVLLAWRQAGDGSDSEFDPGPRSNRGARVRYFELLRRGISAERILRAAYWYFDHFDEDRVQTLAGWLRSEEFTDPDSYFFVPEHHHHGIAA